MSAPHVWASIIMYHRGVYSKGGQVLCTCSALCAIESVLFCRHSHRIFANVNILCQSSYGELNVNETCPNVAPWGVLLGVDQKCFRVFVHNQLRQRKPPFFCYPLRHICTPWVMFVWSDMYECTQFGDSCCDMNAHMKKWPNWGVKMQLLKSPQPNCPPRAV